VADSADVVPANRPCWPADRADRADVHCSVYSRPGDLVRISARYIG